MAWLSTFWRVAVSQSGSDSLDKWPAIGLLLVVGGVVFGAFRTGFVRFGSDVKELLAEKESRLRERDERIEELKAELAESHRALSAANDVLKQSNLTSAKATRVLEGVAVLLAKKSAPPTERGGRGE